MITPELLPYITTGVGLLTGFIITWLLMNAKVKSQASVAAEKLLSSSEKNQQLIHDLETLRKKYDDLQVVESALRQTGTELEVRLKEEKKAADEKQAMLEKAEARLTDTFKALSADALKSTQDQFLSMAKNSLKVQQQEASSELEKRKTAVEQLVKPISQTLEKVQNQISESEKMREGDKQALKQQIVHITEANLGLQKETSKLVKALRQPTGRGQWGEMQLRRVVEMAGMQEHCDFETQTTTTNDEGKRLRPDLIVKLPGGQQIVVDSKAPMDAYLDGIEADDDDQRATAMARHAAQVRNHIQQLSSKRYQDQFATTPEFVVLFLPSEAFFSAALAEDSTLIEQGVDQGVILATPTTLIALLRAVSFGWRQEALAQNAREISAVGRELYTRLGAFAGHVQKLGRSLNSAVGDYNKTVGSLETRILTGARKFEALGASPESSQIEVVEGLESVPREIRSDLPVYENPEIPSGEDFAIANSDHQDKAFGFQGFTSPGDSNQPDPSSAADDLRSAFE
ncbi:DNA recombination protein RmuC [Verrucomicrobiaceae bacterium R5-34]|uniref:DNA recombination protein RmuC n=1 Tax=Oceaniferula flava TaxID=2800421 RepID=A0AAE2VCB3_9BACT|nr:DNA recombination protein RmuC [Oceaniferula flavus]MBK1831296.1 DNA recombination protein RmuC [Verrucomicrobiaceae bacterium R5-34]MBK1855465.1 DNA recombination protein RmuC [Oceaniferula flavus]MBM1136771.1 DNA recombination protein RmuC [Oceaniferula flavus]